MDYRAGVVVEASDHDDARELAIVRDDPPEDHTVGEIVVVALEEEPAP